MLGAGWAMVAIAAYCGYRAVAPGAQAHAHGRDVGAWHSVMALGMAAMVLLPSHRALGLVAIGVYALGLLWGLGGLAWVRRRGAHAGLAVGFAAMLAMAVPGVAEASPGSTTHSHGMAHSPEAMATGSAATMAAPPALLVAALLVGLAVVGVSAAVHVARSRTTVGALDSGCEVAMALAMAVMLAGMV